MVDSHESLDLIDSLAGAGHPAIGVCLDVDASLKLGPLHLGVRRSPVHSAEHAGRAGPRRRRPAGIRAARRHVLRRADRRACPTRRLPCGWSRSARPPSCSTADRSVVAAVREHAELRIVNAGGTGSLEVTGADPSSPSSPPGPDCSPRPVRRLRRVRVAPGGVLRARRRPQAGRRHRHAVLRRLHRVRGRRRRTGCRSRPGRRAQAARRRGRRRGADPGQGRGRPRPAARRPRPACATPRPARCASASTRSRSSRPTARRDRFPRIAARARTSDERRDLDQLEPQRRGPSRTHRASGVDRRRLAQRPSSPARRASGQGVGAGHSFTAIAATDGVLLRLDRMNRVLAHDSATGRVRVQAGISLHDLNPQLLRRSVSRCRTSATSTRSPSPAPSRPAPTAPAAGCTASPRRSSACSSSPPTARWSRSTSSTRGSARPG